MSRRHFTNSSEVLEASLHPGGLLRGIQARRSFSQSAIITRLQSAARRHLAYKRFVILQQEAFPAIKQRLDGQIAVLMKELGTVDGECVVLKSRANGVEQRVAEWMEWTKEKEDSLAKTEKELTGETVSRDTMEAQIVALETVKVRLKDQLARISEGESKLEALRGQVEASAEQFGHNAEQDPREIVRMLKESRERMELYLETQEAGSGQWEVPHHRATLFSRPSPTLIKLNRTVRSPYAPSHLTPKPKPTSPAIASRNPSSRIRPTSLLPPSTSLKRMRSDIPQSSPISEPKSGGRIRFSAPPPSRPRVLSATKAEVFVVPDRREIQKSLRSFYAIPNTPDGDTNPPPTQPSPPSFRGHRSMSSQDSTVSEDLPPYVFDLLSSLDNDPLRVEGPGTLKLNVAVMDINGKGKERTQRPRNPSSGTIKTSKTDRSLKRGWLRGVKERVLG
jgi:hypothetical protein